MHHPGNPCMNASYAARGDAARPCNGWPAGDWKMPDTSCLPMICGATPVGALHQERLRRMTTWPSFRHSPRNRPRALHWYCLAPTLRATEFWPSGCKTAQQNISSSVIPQTIRPPRHSRQTRPSARPPEERPRSDPLTFNLSQLPLQLTSLQLNSQLFP